MTEQEIEELKLQVAKRMEAGLQQFVGEPLTARMAEVVKGYVRSMLKDVLAETGREILDMIDVTVEVDGNTCKVGFKPQSDLSNADYRRVQAFLMGEEFW